MLDINELERTLQKLSPDTLVLCRFFLTNGKVDERWVRLGDCERIAKVIESCKMWQPFIAMHRAINL